MDGHLLSSEAVAQVREVVRDFYARSVYPQSLALSKPTVIPHELRRVRLTSALSAHSTATAYRLEWTGSAYTPDTATTYTLYDIAGISAVSGADLWAVHPHDVDRWEIVGGPRNSQRFRIVTEASYTVADDDEIIYADSSVVPNAISVNLPAATGSGRILTIKYVGNDGTKNVTVTAQAGEFIDLADTTFPLDMPMFAITIQDADEGQWFLVSEAQWT